MAHFPLTRSTDRAGCCSGSPRGIYVSMNAGSVGDHRAFLGDNVLQDRNHVSKTKLQRNAMVVMRRVIQPWVLSNELYQLLNLHYCHRDVCHLCPKAGK